MHLKTQYNWQFNCYIYKYLYLKSYITKTPWTELFHTINLEIQSIFRCQELRQVRGSQWAKENKMRLLCMEMERVEEKDKHTITCKRTLQLW